MSIYGGYSGKIFDTDLSAVAATYIHWRLHGLGSRVAVTLSGKADMTANIITHLQSFKVTFHGASGIDPDSALCVTKTGCGRQPGQTSHRTDIVCHACGENGHKIVNCMNRDKWASYADQKDTSEGNLTSTFAIDSESYLF